MGSHNPNDQEPTYRFIQRLGKEHEDVAALGCDLANLARLAADRMPVSSRLSGDMLDAAAQVGILAERAQGWEARARRGNARDVKRVEEPRKSPQAEAAADVGRALREI